MKNPNSSGYVTTTHIIVEDLHLSTSAIQFEDGIYMFDFYHVTSLDSDVKAGVF